MLSEYAQVLSPINQIISQKNVSQVEVNKNFKYKNATGSLYFEPQFVSLAGQLNLPHFQAS